MDSMLKKLMEKKQGGKMDPEYKSAKMGVLKELHKTMGGMMGDDVKGLKKVTVAAPDKAGLKLGLSKAEEVVEGEQPDEGVIQSLGDGSEEVSEEMPSTPEEVDAKIAELEALKAQMMKAE